MKSFLYRFWRLGQWLRYYFGAKTIYNLHSTFETQAAQVMLEDRRNFYVFSFAKMLRGQLTSNALVVEYDDLGAPSMAMSGKKRSLGKIARHTAVNPETGKRLFRLVQWLKPQTMLELGAGLGVSTLYQAAAARNSIFIALEGQTALAARTAQHIREYGFDKVTVRAGLFKDTLPEALRSLQKLDYLFIDGDHRYEAVKANFYSCQPFFTENAVVVIADIHWSEGMLKAWHELRQSKGVSLSIDLYDIGILFFRNGQKQAQHLALVPFRWKPWKIGIFSA